MDSSSNPYSENTDLYLQLLDDAQRIEDQRLARLVLRRLKGCGCLSAGGDPSSNVIRFPQPTPTASKGTEYELFWQDNQFWQNLVQFLFLLFAGATWITLPFILAGLLQAKM
jgi:hypothetical protein